MAVNLSPVGGVAAQFFTNTGAVLTGGKLFTYLAGTTTPAATYTSSSGNTAWTNPIVLDAAGRVPSGGEIWLTDGLLYKFVLKDANDVLIATYDNISGINSNFVAFVNQQEIVTATAGQTVFNLGISYQPGTNSLSVFVDGVNQYGPGAQYSYVETDSDTVTFNAGLHVGAEVKFTTTQQQGAGAVDAEQVSYQPPFTGAVATNVEVKLAQTISVKDFGAVGDFDPTTGSGTDDRIAIQSALNYAMSVDNCKVVFPQGNYYLGTGYTSSISGLTSQLILGNQTTPNAVVNVTLEGNGGAIYQGAPGIALYLGNCNGCRITGLKFVGYAGGTLGPSREYDSLITIGNNSQDILIDHNYITNSLGWTITQTGDPTVAGGGTTYTCKNVRIVNNTIKMRYGDGVVSYLGGSQSTRAFQTIDSIGLQITGNVIFGNLDLEPNVNGQHLVDIDVSNNQFLSGYVTPIIPSGPSNYWADEELNAPGSGSIIQGAVSVDAIPGAPVVQGISISYNSFDYGIINIGSEVYKATVLGNVFYLGKINVGNPIAVSRFYNISGNSCYEVTDATSGFIVFRGSVSNSQFNDNCVINQDIPVISWDGVSGSDGGGNSYVGNSSLACVSLPAIKFNTGLNAASTQIGTKDGYDEIRSYTTTLTDGTNAATLNVDTLYYRIEGRQVTFTARLFITSAGSLGAAGNVYITLPVVANNTSSMRYIVNVASEQNFTPSANTVQVFGEITENTDKCYIWQTSSSGVKTSIAAANFATDASLIVSGAYFVD